MKEGINWLKDALTKSVILLVVGFVLYQGFGSVRNLVDGVVQHANIGGQQHTANRPKVVQEAVRVEHTHPVQHFHWVSRRSEAFVSQKMGSRIPTIRINRLGEQELSHFVIFESYENKGVGKFFGLQTPFGENLIRRTVLDLNQELKAQNQTVGLDLKDWFPNELVNLPEGRSRCSIHDPSQRLLDPMVMNCHLMLQLNVRGQAHREAGKHFLPYFRVRNSGELSLLPNNEGLRLLGIGSEVVKISQSEYASLEH